MKGETGEKKSCRNCTGIDLVKKEPVGKHLPGRYRYECSRRRNGFISGFLSSDEKLDLLSCEKWQGRKDAEWDTNQREEYECILQGLFDRWNLWKRSGGPDSDVPDGIQLNYLRREIEETVEKAEAALEETDYPECLYSPLPPRMEDSYMADCGTIQSRAAYAFQTLTENQDYQWLLENASRMNHADRRYGEAYRILCQVESLRLAIRENNYFRMKQQSHVEELAKELALYRENAKLPPFTNPGSRKNAANQQLIGQMDIFECDLKAS